MEKVLKGYIFRMYPNEKQIELIEKSFGYQRCTSRNERDINASINIMFEGIKLYMNNRGNELQVS